jgi:hypothetical protein
MRKQYAYEYELQFSTKFPVFRGTLYAMAFRGRLNKFRKKAYITLIFKKRALFYKEHCYKARQAT